MNSHNKPNFLSQPIVKNIFVYRNGDPYYEARRIVLNQKRVNNFETFLRDVTGGVQAPFGAVRNIYTPRCGHKVDSLDLLQSGEQYVAAGREKFKKLDYLHIGSRKKPTLQSIATRTVPVRQNRLLVSARFLKPINEPCTVFIVANGDVLDPALRLLIPQRILGQFDRVLDLITERIGFRILGGVRSLYTFEGQQVTDGKLLENGQFFVACGREKFKKLPYQDLLFTKPRGVRRIVGSRATTLPPIYRFSKQNGNSKSQARSSDSGESKTPPPPGEPVKEHLSSIVREISQARLISLRRKRSRMSMSLGYPDNEFADEADGQKPQDLPSEEKPLPEENGKEVPGEEGAIGEKEVEEHEEEKEEEGRERLKQQAEQATVGEQQEEGGTANEGNEDVEEEETEEEETKEEGKQDGKVEREVEEKEVAKDKDREKVKRGRTERKEGVEEEEGKEEFEQEGEAGSVHAEETGEGDGSGEEEKLDDCGGGQTVGAENGEGDEDGEKGEDGERDEDREQGGDGERDEDKEKGEDRERDEDREPGGDGERGEDGEKGEDGERDEDREPGGDGERGEDGEKGEDGERDEDREPGGDGERDEDREQGGDGERGEDGEKGEDGERDEDREPGGDGERDEDGEKREEGDKEEEGDGSEESGEEEKTEGENGVGGDATGKDEDK